MKILKNEFKSILTTYSIEINISSDDLKPSKIATSSP